MEVLSFAILITTIVMAVFLKKGFNEVIRGLESIDAKLSKPPF